jgi:hypothetical protein
MERRGKAEAVRRNVTTPRTLTDQKRHTLPKNEELRLDNNIPRIQMRDNTPNLISQKTAPKRF